MSNADLLSFYERFRLAYHLDSPNVVPEAVLEGSKLEIYQALSAEVAARKPTA